MLRTVKIGQRLPPVGVQIVHHQMNLSRLGVTTHQGPNLFGELRRRAIRCDPSEVPAGFRFHPTEDMGRSSPFVLAVAAADPSGYRGDRLPHLGTQRYGLLIQTDDRLAPSPPVSWLKRPAGGITSRACRSLTPKMWLLAP